MCVFASSLVFRWASVPRQQFTLIGDESDETSQAASEELHSQNGPGCSSARSHPGPAVDGTIAVASGRHSDRITIFRRNTLYEVGELLEFLTLGVGASMSGMSFMEKSPESLMYCARDP